MSFAAPSICPSYRFLVRHISNCIRMVAAWLGAIISSQIVQFSPAQPPQTDKCLLKPPALFLCTWSCFRKGLSNMKLVTFDGNWNEVWLDTRPGPRRSVACFANSFGQRTHRDFRSEWDWRRRLREGTESDKDVFEILHAAGGLWIWMNLGWMIEQIPGADKQQISFHELFMSISFHEDAYVFFSHFLWCFRTDLGLLTCALASLSSVPSRNPSLTGHDSAWPLDSTVGTT